MNYQPSFHFGKLLGLGCAAAAVMGMPLMAHAYQVSDGNRWNNSSQTVSSPNQGDPITLSWSIVPDGTAIPGTAGTTGGIPGESADPSSLISFFDGLYGNGGGGADLTTRPWFPIFNSSYERWESVSGLSFEYEPADDGVPMYSKSGTSLFGGATGSDGVRGDMRIGAHSMDGQSGGNVLAYNFFPEVGEHVIDTDNSTLFGDATGGSLLARNVFTHEAGHGIGLSHVEPSNGTKLMEPFISGAYDGPQLDDVQAAQRLYGDALEKNGGNDTFGTATPLGPVTSSTTVSIGTDSDDLAVAYTDTDFVSIDDDSDTDFFSFSISEEGEISLVVTPKGPTYDEGPQGGFTSSFDSSAQSDLALTLFDIDGITALASANLFGLGGTESILNFLLSDVGTYFARITGSDNALQLYQLDVSFFANIPEPATAVLLVMGGAMVVGRKRRTA